MNKFARLVSASAAAATLTLSAAPGAGAAALNPQQVAGDTPVGTVSPLNTPITGTSPKWRQLTKNDPRVEPLSVFSPSMNRSIDVAVIKAPNPGAPTLYFLNGAGGAEQDNDWITLGEDFVDFYHSKGVNVVIPMDGAFTYYIDWAHDAPGDGRAVEAGPQRWDTFLTKELPGPIEQHLNANNNRAIAGFSMSAYSAAILAEHNPGFYDAVAGFSGVYSTADPLAQAVHNLTLERGGANSNLMLGPAGGPHARYNDAIINAEGLRNTELYFSTGSGLAGETDMMGYLAQQGHVGLPGSLASANLQIVGGLIEAATSASTHLLDSKLKSLGIHGTFNYRPTGTHSWPSWRQDQIDSWPVLERGLFR